MKAATNLHLVPRLRIRLAKSSILPLPPWRSLMQQMLAESPTPLINITESTTYVLTFRLSVEVASRLVSVLLDLADGVYELFILSQACIHCTQLHF